MTRVKSLVTTRLVGLLKLAGLMMGLACVGQAELKASILGPLLSNDLQITARTDRMPVAFDGNQYLVVYSQPPTSSMGGQIYGQFVDRLGDAAGAPFVIASKPGSQQGPVLAFDGSYYFVVWRDNGTNDSLRGRVVSTTGALMGSELMISPGTRSMQAIASDGHGGFLVVFANNNTPTFDIYGQMMSVSIAGIPSLIDGPIAIATTSQPKLWPNVSFGESAYLVTWTNDPFTNGASDVFGKLITPSPMTISPTITISDAPQRQGDRKAGIAFGAGYFLVVFDDHRNGGDDIYATRVSESGVVQDPPGFVIATDTGCSPHEPNVVFAETMWVIVWGCPLVKGVRVDTSGVVIDPVPGDLTITNSATVIPEIAFDGEHFLVTFGRLSSQASHAQLVGLLTANLSITQSGLPDPAVSNGDITYSVAVTNHGPNLAPSIAITDALPPGTTFVSASVPGGICSYASGTVVCNLGRTFAGTTTTATIIVKATTAGTMTNSATVTSLADDPEPGNNTTSISTTVNAAANLTLSKIGTPNTVYVGNTLTYTLTVGNIGPSQATDVTLTDPLPASVTVISVASSQGVCVVANPLSCWIGTLADGASASVTITVIPTAEGSITNSASVTAAEGDPNPGNNVASTETVVLPSANLGVTMVATPNALLAGFNLTYSIIVSNAGPSMATQVLLNDSLPLGVLVVSATPSQGTCTTGPTILCALGTIANGSNATATIVVTPTVAGSLTNSVSVAGSEADFVPGNNTDSISTTVTAAPDLSITHSSSPNPVFSGSNLTYTINVANAGPSTATGVTIVDSLPAGVTFVSASTSQGTCSGSGPVSCVLGNLPSGGAAAAMIVVRPSSAGTIVNTASVMANESDPNPGNNTATATTTVNPPSPPQQISDLIALLDSFNLPPPANSLRNKLLGIQNKITQNQLNAACNDLMAFNNEVMAQTGKLLTPAQANQLITGANLLRMTLGC